VMGVIFVARAPSAAPPADIAASVMPDEPLALDSRHPRF
jgi:hypothetical protein